MVVPCYWLQSSLEPWFGIGSVSTMKDNEMLYIIEGVDLYGRKFSGRYNKEDANYLLATDRLNRLVKVISLCDTLNS
jgi:hypothetical protein